MTLSMAEIAARQLADYDARQPGRISKIPIDFEHRGRLRGAAARRRAACRSRRTDRRIQNRMRQWGGRRQLGASTPVFGHLFETEVYRSGAFIDAARFCRLAVEGELAVRISDDPLIVSVFPVIELHNNLLRGAKHRIEELIANNALHAGLVIPSHESGTQTCRSSVPPLLRYIAAASRSDRQAATRYPVAPRHRWPQFQSTSSPLARLSSRAKSCSPARHCRSTRVPGRPCRGVWRGRGCRGLFVRGA